MDQSDQLSSSSDDPINQLDSENYSIFKSIKNIINDEKLSDVTFLVGENKKMIYSHKLVLSLGSPVFEKMFHGEFEHKSDAIEIIDITETGFLNMLKYIYGYEIDFDLSELYESYKALDKYLVLGSHKKISQYIEQKLNKSNCCIIYDQLVKMDKKDDFLDFVESFIQINCSAAFFSESFLKIDEDTLIKLLNLDYLNLDEFNILKACSNWVNYKVEECDDKIELFKLRQEKFKKIKHFIKLSELTVEELGWSSKFSVLSFKEMGALFIRLKDESNEQSIITCKTKRRSIRSFTIEDKGTYCNKVSNISPLNRILSVNRKILISSISTFINSRFEVKELYITENYLNINFKYEKREVNKKWAFYFTPYLELDPEKIYFLGFELGTTCFRFIYLSEREQFTYACGPDNYCVNIFLKCPYEFIDCKYHLIQKIDFFDCSMSSLS